MKKAFVLGVVLLMFAAPLYAEEMKQSEPKVSGEASIALMSNYVWRGIKLSDGFVVQPTAGLSYAGFGMNLWANIDYDSDKIGAHADHITETDFTLNYAKSFGPVGIDVGYIHYGVVGANTQEIYGSVSYDTLLSPSLTLYYDVDQGDGGFLTAAIGHSFPIKDITALDLGLTVGVNLDNSVMGTNADGETFTNLYNADFSVSAGFDVMGVTITPMVAVTFALSDDAEDAIKGAEFSKDALVDGDPSSTHVYGGVSASISF